MFFRLSFVTLALALVALGTPVKRDAAKVEWDIGNLTTMSESLDKSIKAFPNSGGTLAEAWAIYQAATDLADSVKTATNDVTGSAKFTNEEANSILKVIDNFVPHVQTTCDDLVAKKTAMTNIGAAPIDKKALETLKANADAFAAALSPKMPADAQGSVQKQLNEVDAALTGAIKAFTE